MQMVQKSDNTFERLIYYEVEIEKVGIDKSITVGPTLGKHFTYFTSSAIPGLRDHSYGLAGDLGILYDANTREVSYGPAF